MFMYVVVCFKYKLEIQVSDGKSFGNFVLWDQDCYNLIGISDIDLTSKMIKVLLLHQYEFNFSQTTLLSNN